MLKGIDPVLSPDLLKTLCEMGHGDEIVFTDAHFPAASVARAGGTVYLRADGVDIHYPGVVDAAYVSAVKAAGFSFHVWTVDDPALARRAFEIGVDTLTTNRAKFILEACGK